MQQPPVGICHCTVVFTHPLCAVWAEMLVVLSLTPWRGLVVSIVVTKFVSCYYKTETNSVPWQLAVVTL